MQWLLLDPASFTYQKVIQHLVLSQAFDINLCERLEEHFSGPSSIYDHANTTGHHTRVDSFSVFSRESHNIARTIKEAMYIRVKDPSLNRNIVKYHLSHIWPPTLINPSTISGAHCICVTPLRWARRCRVSHFVSTAQHWVGAWSYHQQFGVIPIGTRFHSSYNQWYHMS